MLPAELPYEGKRLSLIFERDGEDEAINFAARTYRAYRLSLKFGMAREKHFRRTYLESCVDLRKYLKAHGIYGSVARKIKYA